MLCVTQRQIIKSVPLIGIWYLHCAYAKNYTYNKRMQLQKVAIFETVNGTESFKSLKGILPQKILSPKPLNLDSKGVW